MNKNFLEIDNVTFTASAKNKVNNVSFQIENKGDIICLLGPSGIGKTTILRTIAGLERIDSGKITLNNNVISSNDTHVEPENRNISLAFQDNSLFPHYNVIQNIKFGAERNKNKKKNLNMAEIIKFLHLELVVDKFPHQISSGEAQRASLASNGIKSGYLKINYSIDESAYLLGYSKLKTFTNIHIPYLKNSILLIGILISIEIIKELPITLIMRPFNFETFATKAYIYASQDLLEAAAAPSLFLIIIASFFILITSKYILKD